MLSFWSKWLTEKSVSRPQKARRDRSHAPAAAQIEKFEGRCLPSISTLVSLSPGSTTDRTLTITATAADTITIGVNATKQVTINGSIVNAAVSATNVSALIVNGGTGNNRIDLSAVTAASFPRLNGVRVDGGAGNDRITGSPLADSLTGGDRKSTRLNSSHPRLSRMPSSA